MVEWVSGGERAMPRDRIDTRARRRPSIRHFLWRGGKMNRRNAPMPERYAVLTDHAYPSSTSAKMGPRNAVFEKPWRSDSPFENPYEMSAQEPGAPKKDAQNSFVSLFSGTSAQQSSAADLEEQNDARLSGLSERIKLLKDISTGIGKEARESTAEMNSLNDLFSNASSLLGNTFHKMTVMARRQRGWFCNMMLFIMLVIWIFVFLWWWRK